MSNSKRPHAPKEEKRGAQEIQLSHLDNRFSCQIDGTVIQNVKDYSLVQSSNGKALLNLTIEISAEVVSTTIHRFGKLGQQSLLRRNLVIYDHLNKIN